jgi:hypothetical protein
MLMITSKIKIYLGEKNPPQPRLELGCVKAGFLEQISTKSAQITTQNMNQPNNLNGPTKPLCLEQNPLSSR